METTHMLQEALTVPTEAPPVERAHQGKSRTPCRRPEIDALGGLQVVQDSTSGHDSDGPGSKRERISTRRSRCRLEQYPHSITVPPVRYL